MIKNNSDGRVGAKDAQLAERASAVDDISASLDPPDGISLKDDAPCTSECKLPDEDHPLAYCTTDTPPPRFRLPFRARLQGRTAAAKGAASSVQNGSNWVACLHPSHLGVSENPENPCAGPCDEDTGQCMDAEGAEQPCARTTVVLKHLRRYLEHLGSKTLDDAAAEAQARALRILTDSGGGKSPQLVAASNRGETVEMEDRGRASPPPPSQHSLKGGLVTRKNKKHQKQRAFARMTVKQLRTELRKRGKSEAGRKQELIERLETYDDGPSSLSSIVPPLTKVVSAVEEEEEKDTVDTTEVNHLLLKEVFGRVLRTVSETIRKALVQVQGVLQELFEGRLQSGKRTYTYIGLLEVRDAVYEISQAFRVLERACLRALESVRAPLSMEEVEGAEAGARRAAEHFRSVYIKVLRGEPALRDLRTKPKTVGELLDEYSALPRLAATLMNKWYVKWGLFFYLAWTAWQAAETEARVVWDSLDHVDSRTRPDDSWFTRWFLLWSDRGCVKRDCEVVVRLTDTKAGSAFVGWVDWFNSFVPAWFSGVKTWISGFSDFWGAWATPQTVRATHANVEVLLRYFYNGILRILLAGGCALLGSSPGVTAARHALIWNNLFRIFLRAYGHWMERTFGAAKSILFLSTLYALVTGAIDYLARYACSLTRGAMVEGIKEKLLQVNVSGEDGQPITFEADSKTGAIRNYYTKYGDMFKDPAIEAEASAIIKHVNSGGKLSSDEVIREKQELLIFSYQKYTNTTPASAPAPVPPSASAPAPASAPVPPSAPAPAPVPAPAPTQVNVPVEQASTQPQASSETPAQKNEEVDRAVNSVMHESQYGGKIPQAVLEQHGREFVQKYPELYEPCRKVGMSPAKCLDIYTSILPLPLQAYSGLQDDNGAYSTYRAILDDIQTRLASVVKTTDNIKDVESFLKSNLPALSYS